MRYITLFLLIIISTFAISQKRAITKDLGLSIKIDSVMTTTDGSSIKSDSTTYTRTIQKSGIPYQSSSMPRDLISQIESYTTSIQTGLDNTKIYRVTPVGAGQGNTYLEGVVSTTASGSTTTRAHATSSLLTRLARVGYTSSATAGTSGGIRIPYLSITTGTKVGDASIGGFKFNCKFAIGDASLISAARTFIGVYGAATAFPTSNPSTLTNIIGIGHDAGATSWSIIWGGSSAQTPISLGANFPIDLTTVIDFSIYSPKGIDNKVYYEIKNINTGATSYGTLTANTVGVELPSPSTLLCPLQMNRTNNTTASSVTIDLISYTCQINY